MTRFAVVVLVLALAAGCGDDEGAGADQLPDENVPAAPKVTNEITVRTTEFALDPARATAGEAGLVTIEIVNEGDAAHSLAVDGPNGLVELDGRIEAGATSTLEVDLDKPGTYEWYCPLDGHRAKGMDGTVTVGGEDAARGPDSTITTPTQTDTTETESESESESESEPRTRTQTETQTETQTRTTTQTETVTTPRETDDGPTATVRTPSDSP